MPHRQPGAATGIRLSCSHLDLPAATRWLLRPSAGAAAAAQPGLPCAAGAGTRCSGPWSRRPVPAGSLPPGRLHRARPFGWLAGPPPGPADRLWCSVRRCRRQCGQGPALGRRGSRGSEQQRQQRRRPSFLGSLGSGACRSGGSHAGMHARCGRGCLEDWMLQVGCCCAGSPGMAWNGQRAPCTSAVATRLGSLALSPCSPSPGSD